MPSHLVDKPFRITFAAIGVHQYTGEGWVLQTRDIKTASGEIVPVYLVQMDNPPEDGKYIVLGDGEILERGEPVDWSES